MKDRRGDTLVVIRKSLIIYLVIRKSALPNVVLAVLLRLIHMDNSDRLYGHRH